MENSLFSQLKRLIDEDQNQVINLIVEGLWLFNAEKSVSKFRGWS